MLQKGADCRATAIDLEVYKNRVTMHLCGLRRSVSGETFTKKMRNPVTKNSISVVQCDDLDRSRKQPYPRLKPDHKVYFPRLIVPAASMAVNFVDFLICFAMLVLMMCWYRFLPGWQIILLPLFMLLAYVANIGIDLWIAALNVRFRDFRYLVPFAVRLGLLSTPVGFSSNITPDEWRWLYSLNPVAGIIDGLRWCILASQGVYLPGFCWSLCTTGLFLWLGIRQFRKVERRLADLL